jgi:magnesium chelatase family protein
VGRYQERLSGPLLDRIDIRVQVARTPVDLDARADGESSMAVGARVAAARCRQLARAGALNARLSPEATREWCLPDAAGRRLLENAAEKLCLSRRACDRALRVARTIADLAGRDAVTAADVAEAVGLRLQSARME